MTWLAQIRHVLVKDVRQSRRMIAVHAAVVAVATASALTPFVHNTWFVLTSLLVVVTGVVLVAAVVQGDSPTRSDAFWASRPIHPTAMLAAKLCFALLVVLGIALAGQLVGLREHDAPWRAIPRHLGISVTVYCILLLLAVVVAALTRDLRSFLLSLLVVVLGLVITSGVLPDLWSRIAPVSVRAVFTAASIAAGLAWLVVVYRQHDLRRGIRALGVATLGLMVVSVTAPRSPAAHDAEADVSVPRARVDATVTRLGGIGERPELGVTLGVEAPPLQRLVLEESAAHVRLRDGSELRIAGQRLPIVLRHGAPPTIPGVRWTAENRGTGIRQTLRFDLSPEQRRAIARGVSDVAVELRLGVSESRLAGRIPLRTGAVFERWGRRVRVERWDSEFGEGSVQLVTTTVADGGRTEPPIPIGWDRSEEFALLNAREGDAIPLRREGSSGSSGWLVLPGTELRYSTTEYVALPIFENRMRYRRDEAWFRGTELLVIDWARRGSYTVRPTAVVDTASRAAHTQPREATQVRAVPVLR